ncbi:MAG: hypothetical protein IPJ26_06000 [Bacteroidetes bacterium]|nr:hypothetical protein [Bacteroidota bacterium]
MNTRHYLILLALCPTLSFAQTGGGKTGNLGNEDINVIKEYQPVLNDAFKININPDSDTSTIRKANTPEYKVSAQPINSNYNTSPIKPVRIKDDAIKKLYHGYVKAGYGLENMPLLDISFNSLRSKNFDAGVRFKHLSTSGKIKEYGFPGNSNNLFKVFGTRYFDKFKIGANLAYNRDVVHFYGYNSPPELFSKSETKHSMSDFDGNVNLASINPDKDSWTYQASVGFYNFEDNRSSSENNAKVELGIGKLLTNAKFNLQVSGEFGKIKQALYSINRSIIRFQPRFIINENLYSIEVGGNVAIESRNNPSGITPYSKPIKDNNYHLYPYLSTSYQVIDDAVKIFATLSGDLQRNDLRNISRENPFFGRNVLLNNTNEKLGIKAGTSIKLEHDLMFVGSVKWSRIKDQPFYYANFEIPSTFAVVYDKATLLNFRASLEYKNAEKISFAFSADYNKYKTDQLNEQLYIPALRVGISGHYAIAEKIYLKADVFYNSDVSGNTYISDSTIVSAQFVNIKGWLDANIGIDYRYSKVLSAFVSLNNIGFSRYFRWYEYPSYRFLGMAGVTYSF